MSVSQAAAHILLIHQLKPAPAASGGIRLKTPAPADKVILLIQQLIPVNQTVHPASGGILQQIAVNQVQSEYAAMAIAIAVKQAVHVLPTADLPRLTLPIQAIAATMSAVQANLLPAVLQTAAAEQLQHIPRLLPALRDNGGTALPIPAWVLLTQPRLMQPLRSLILIPLRLM